MSLRTGTELINLLLLINKLTGLYGLLAILTGYHLSGVQISMYLYSLAALALGVHLTPHIRRGASSPLQNLALAWLHVVDAVVNALYTTAFGLAWFMVLAESQGEETPNIPVGDKMMGDVAGFNDPTYVVSAVDVVVTSPAGGSHNALPAQEAHLIGHQATSMSSTSSTAGLRERLLPSGSTASITTIVILWLARVYFILVVCAFARAVLRQHIVAQSQATTGYAPPTTETGGALYAENPFLDTPGWRGSLGRAMLRVARGYWLGVEPEETASGAAAAAVAARAPSTHTAEWARSLSGKFDRRKGSQSVDMTSPASNGTADREHRRRAGTGPPLLQPVELENLRK